METIYLQHDISENTSSKRDQSLLYYAVKMCRKHRLLNERITLLSPLDQLHVIQLCLTVLKKKLNGIDFLETTESILLLAVAVNTQKFIEMLKNAGCEKHAFTLQALEVLSLQESKEYIPLLDEYNSFMNSNNHIDGIDVFRIFILEILKPDSSLGKDVAAAQFIFQGKAQDVLQALLVELLSKYALLAPVTSTTLSACFRDLKNASQDNWELVSSLHIGVEKQQCPKECEDLGVVPAVTPKTILCEIFQSYLHLLVNTRSELAFAHIFNVPERGLNHWAFTHLKHEAQKKKMSLYQTALSLMAQLQLGGQGYAPTADNSLIQYVKGFGLLTTLMNRLQIYLEEIDCTRSSIMHVVSAIKRILINGKNKHFDREAVEEIANVVQTKLDQILSAMHQDGSLVSPDKPASKGGSLTCRRSQRAILYYLDSCSASFSSCLNHCHFHMWLKGGSLSPRSPSHFPSTLSVFRSPEAPEQSSVIDARKKNDTKGLKNKNMNVSSNIATLKCESQPVVDRCSKELLETVSVPSSIPLVHPAPDTITRCLQEKSEENGEHKENLRPKPSPAGKQVEKKARHMISLKSSYHCSLAEQVQLQNLSNRNSDIVESLQPSRPSKKCRRRLLAQVKGQQQITTFFQR